MGLEGSGTLTPDGHLPFNQYSVTTRTSDDRSPLSYATDDDWYPREEVVDALRCMSATRPTTSAVQRTSAPTDTVTGYRWNVDSIWPPGIERTLRLSLPPNHPATGDPVISGTVQVGEELTALTDGIMDDDVLDDVFTYQWVRVDADGTSNEEDITDETDATYTLTADDRGKQVKVEVRFVDILGGEETRTSAPTATLAGVPNTAATGAPTITGTAQVGQTLTASTTGIMDANGLTSPTYTYQWIRVDGTDEADIASANSSTYILVDADLGTTLKVRVTFADDLGHTETLTSAATATVGAVATGPPTVTDVAVTSTPASGTTYYLAGEVIEFTVTFSAPVTVTATPKFAFRLGAATRQAAYASGSDSAALVFARTVQAGEVDRNGISWNAIALALDGGTITQTGATTAARLTHAAQAPLEGHRVDAAPPMQVSASVQGLALVLVYDEPLDPASMPATGAYTVTATVGATATNPAVSEVSIYGIWVTLTLDAAPAAGATVTLAYAPPASNPVQDEAGNDAPAFSGQKVNGAAGNTAPTGAPTITGTAQVGQTLTASTTGIADADGLTSPTYTYQWIRVNGTEADIAGENSSTYILVDADLGTTLKVRVTFADDLGHTETLTSAATATVVAAATAALGQVLGVGVAPGNAHLVVTWTAVDTATGYTVQWMSGSQGYNTGDRQAPVTSGSTTRYTIPSLTNGTEYTVQVIATRTGATDGPPSEEMTGTPRVPPPPPPPPPDLAQVTDVAVTSTPASGTTYYLAGEVIEFTVTFSAPVTVTATPKFAFRLGAATRQAAYASGSDSAALVFARTVQAGEVDRNGISWNALALALDGGTITQTGATTAARLTHAAQAPLEGHRVDAAPPMQVSASVQGLALVLVYDEPLDPASMPATGAYTVTATVGATATNPAVSEVSIYGIWVTLTLDAAPAAGATVTLAYAPPASNPVQDEAGNDAPAFSGQSVRLGPPPPPSGPCAGAGGGGRPGQRAAGGDLDGGGHRHGLHGAVDVGRPGLQHHQPAGHGHVGYDDESHDHGPRQRHRIHGAGERDPDRRHRRPAVGGGDGHAGGTDRSGHHGVDDGGDGDGAGLDRGRLHGGAGYRADGGCRGDGGRARGHGRDREPDHPDLHDVELGNGADGDGDRGRRCGHHGRFGRADPQRGERGQRLQRHHDRRRGGDGERQRHRAGDGGGGRPGQRAAGGDLDGGGHRHGLHGAVDVGRPGLQHHQPAGHGHVGYDDESHDHGPRQRHRIHGAGERDPDRRQRRPAVGGGDGDADSAAAAAAAAAGPCAGAGGGGRPGQRAPGGDLDGGGHRHGLHGAVDVGQPGLHGVDRRPAGPGHVGVDHALHDSQPHQRHGIHGAGDRDPDGRHTDGPPGRGRR